MPSHATAKQFSLRFPYARLCEANGEIVDRPLGSVSRAVMADTMPIRTFRWFEGQRHYPGTYWSATESAHVIYESRLELSRVLLADFDPTVERIFAQPLTIHAWVGERHRLHTPDYLLIRGAELVFVAVKSVGQLDDPEVQETLEWVRDAIEEQGWSFEVASEPTQPYFDNVRFLAGYRRAQSISQTVADEFRAQNLGGMSFGDAMRHSGAAEPVARAALLHLLWAHEVDADLAQPLCDTTLLNESVSQ
ncbi:MULTISPECIES: TnsA-like heteromeric transposase endonuclease subunit [Mycobacterium avium complex (MAC)]|nr:TnsA-like heteromeric transposase endonuclease subunit [Mycobacterium intracellulare]UEB24858.1 TnsA-like heteromeric transposase endonuclease subunit [Mycobacterium intracellulare]